MDVRIAIGIETLTGGGAERIVRQLARGLARRDHRVFVYCLNAAQYDASQLHAAGVTIREAHSTGFDPGLVWRLGRWLRQDRIDVVNAQSSAATVFLLPAAKALGIPIIQTRQGVLLGTPTRYRRWAEQLATYLDGVGVVTPALLKTLPPGRVRRDAFWLPNCIDRERLEPDTSRRLLETLVGRQLGSPVILTVGTVCAEKDPIGLLRAFARLRDEIRSARLIWIGPTRDAAYRDSTHAMQRALGLEGWVHWLGSVENAYRVMAGADVFCLPSRTEAMPVAVVEAMSQGVPIVATAVGGIGRVDGAADCGDVLIRDGQTGWLAPPANPQLLADALLSALTNRDEARRRAEAAEADYRRRLTADGMLDRYVAAFGGVLSKRASFISTNSATLADRPRVLMVGPGGPQIGGMVTAIDLLCDARTKGRQFTPLRWATSRRALGARQTRNSGSFHAAARHVANVWRYARALYVHRPDVVHIHTCSYFTFYRDIAHLALARAAAKRCYLHIHGSQFPEFCADAPPWARRLIRWACETADAVFALSNHWSERIRPFVGDARIEVVPNGVPRPRMSLKTRGRSSACRFMYLGAVSLRKGVGELLEAAAALHEADVEFSLDVVGPVVGGDANFTDATARGAASLDEWRRSAAALGVAKQVNFVGPLAGNELESQWRRTDCLVLPSHNEGLPYVLLEAGARGKPVIATRVGGIPELLVPQGECNPLGLLVAANDPVALIAAMMQLAGDAYMRADLGRRFAAHVRGEYGLDQQLRRLREIYDRDLNAGAARRIRRNRSRRWDERVCGGLLYPMHEWLCGRETYDELRALRRMLRVRPSTLDAIRTERVRGTLMHAERETLYYRELLAQCGVNTRATRVDLELQRLPLLEKSTIRARQADMVDPDVPGGPIAYSSGGTTGDTLRFRIDRVRQTQSTAARLAAQEWFGVRPGDRRAYLWGAPIETRAGWFRRLRDGLLNEIVLDAFEMSPEQMDRHVRRLRRFRPRCLYAYPTAAARLAQHIRSRWGRMHFPWLRLVVLTGEEITPEQRDAVQRVFGCPVAAEYGSRETGTIAHECPQGRLHVFASHVHVEILRDLQPVKPGEIGEVIVTMLNTRAQPLLRYRLGDAGTLDNEPCPCGLPLPTMRVTGGKITGFIVLRDGRVAHGAVTSHVVRDERGVIAFKTIQHEVDAFEVLLEVDGQFDAAAPVRIRERYQRLFGAGLRVDVRVVARIEPDPSGKRRYVVSHVADRLKALDVAALEGANTTAASDQDAADPVDAAQR